MELFLMKIIIFHLILMSHLILKQEAVLVLRKLCRIKTYLDFLKIAMKRPHFNSADHYSMLCKPKKVN